MDLRLRDGQPGKILPELRRKETRIKGENTNDRH